MGFSEIPPPPEEHPGQDEPVIRVRPPGPQSRTWLTRAMQHGAPMGPTFEAEQRGLVRAAVPPSAIVYSTALGSNVLDVDSNRYVDLAAGFGAMLVGHRHPYVIRVLNLQSERLLQALGDVHPSEAKIALMERLARLYPERGAKVILGQSGADAVTAALKTAALFTGKPGVLAFRASYHGLSYGPLAATGLRDSYREPFAAQLNPHVGFIGYPGDQAELDAVLTEARAVLARGETGAVLVEPILGRGGCVVPPDGFLRELRALTRERGALLLADEIWTGLGRSGEQLYSLRGGVVPDLLCLGKGLGGGVPVSACVGSGDVMAAWRREQEVVHTATFAGAPLACTTALATLDVLQREDLVTRSRELGERLRLQIERVVGDREDVAAVRGAGLMIGVELRGGPGAASRLQRRLLERGYIASTGGGRRETLVLTPALTIADRLLDGFVASLRGALQASEP